MITKEEYEEAQQIVWDYEDQLEKEGKSLAVVETKQMKTTLKEIKDKRPCQRGLKKLISNVGSDLNTELTPKQILKSNGIQDAIWVLRCFTGIEKEIKLFAADCAESVLGLFENRYPEDKRPRQAIEASRLYIEGEITLEELNEKRYAAYADAAYDAADAAYDAAAAAAYAAARLKEMQKQEELFIKYFCK